MALIKDLADPYDEGTLRAYYRLASLVVDTPMRTIDATFLVYRSRAARAAGKAPFDRITVHADDATTPSYDALAGERTATAESISGLIYGFTKAQPAWAGAEDA